MSAKVRFDADAIRKVARQRVARESIREVAAEIGISRGGLESFLKGREPYTRTRLALTAWYIAQGRAGDPVSRADVDAALAVLFQYVNTAGTKAARAKRVREVTNVLSPGDQP